MERRLYRSKHNRVLLGVCGGIGEYFTIDPVIIRIIAVLLLIPGVFPAVIAYFVLAIIIPLEGSTSASPRDNIRENVSDMKDTGAGIGEEIRTTFQKSPSSSRSDPNRVLWIIGLILVAIGIFFLIFNIFGWLGRFFWPLLLIVIGLIIILLVVRRR